MPKTLLVEDNQMNRDMLSRRLIKKGKEGREKMMQSKEKTMVGGTRRILALGVLLVALMGAWLVLAASPAHAATLTVNSTADNNDLDFPGGTFDGSSDGKCFAGVGSVVAEECTLRAAIQEANVTPGADTINFNIPGTTGLKTIHPFYELPRITGPVIIDGYSQPGTKPNTLVVGNDAVLKIELRGRGLGYGLLIDNAANSAVKGLVINDWRYGIGIGGSGATGNKVIGNYVGTDASGTQDLGNGYYGVFIGNAPNNIIGGATPGERNIISGNGNHGVFISGATTTGNQVIGNYVGTDASGTQDLGNSVDGVSISGAPNNTIGGTQAGARNVISANNSDGVFIYGYSATGNKVMGNYVGTDSNGAADLGNSYYGVHIFAPNNTVGGTEAGARNVISANDSDGVFIYAYSATGNKVMGNYVGTDSNGAAALGNAAAGVKVYSAPNNTVGGTEAGARNVISNNSDGVLIVDANATGNRVLSNSIFSNARLDIDLKGDGVTPNDTNDADSGPNGLQNFPVLHSARTEGGKTTVEGTLHSTPNKTFVVELFSNPPGTEEGKTPLGQTSVLSTNQAGNASFTFTPAQEAVPVGHTITATATATLSGDTSEFSASKTVVADEAPTVKEVFPAENQTGVYLDENVRVFFSEPMSAAIINSDTVKLTKMKSTTSVPATVTYIAEGHEAILDPEVDLQPGAWYIAEVTAGATDVGGTALDQDPSLPGNQPKVWKFQVGV